MNYDIRQFRGDIFGGITSMVVALPVALGFGIASGMGAAAGLYGAIAVGFFASVFGGTKSQISGPTAPMTVAMAVIITNHSATLTEALTIVVLAGAMQILLGMSRVGRFVAYTPHVVVSGFMSGIGIIIMLMQLMPFLGQSGVQGGAVGTVRALPAALDNANFDALIIASVTFAMCFLWPRRLDRAVPGLLVGLVVGTLLGMLWFTDTPVIGPVPTGLPDFHLPWPHTEFLLRAVEPALLLALLGSVDSLLTSLIADSLTGERHNPDRELVGQGLGNMVAGLIGALPGAGATMGTVTNIRAGGQTRISGALRSLLLLALVLGLGQYVESIPLAVLAGVLMRVGWDIIDWRLLLRAHRIRREHLLVMLLTLVLTVFVDLVTAVGIGLIAGGMAHARQLQNLELDSVVAVPLLDRTFLGEVFASEDEYAMRVGLVVLKGSFTVASSNKLVSVIGADIQGHEIVIFDFSETTYIDDSAAMLIWQLIDAADKAETAVIVMGLSNPAVVQTIDALDILESLPAERIVGDREEARDVARKILGRKAPVRGRDVVESA